MSKIKDELEKLEREANEEISSREPKNNHDRLLARYPALKSFDQHLMNLNPLG